MIVYSVASKQSFEMCRIIRDKILNHLVCARTFIRLLVVRGWLMLGAGRGHSPSDDRGE